MIFILGMVTGAALMALAFWLQRSGIVIKWYEWLLSALGFILLVWAVNDFFASMSEHNETAARVLLVMLGVPALILLALAVFLVWWRSYHAKRTSASDAK